MKVSYNAYVFLCEISFAVVNIFYAIFISSAEMPIWFIAFMVPFVIVFWGNHILMGVSNANQLSYTPL